MYVKLADTFNILDTLTTIDAHVSKQQSGEQVRLYFDKASERFISEAEPAQPLTHLIYQLRTPNNGAKALQERITPESLLALDQQYTTKKERQKLHKIVNKAIKGLEYLYKESHSKSERRAIDAASSWLRSYKLAVHRTLQDENSIIH